MGKGVRHTSVGSELTQEEFEAETSHYLASGTSFPASPSEGDLFYRTDQHKWHIYNGSAWKELTVEQLHLEAKSVQSDYNGGWSASWTTAFSSTPTVVCSREDSGQGYPVCSSKSTTACSGVIKDYAGGGEHYANVGVHAREPT